MASTSNGKIYEFADFRLDPAENLLLRNGEPISLKPKAFSALVLLVENHGSLVEKSELMDGIWGDSFVEEGAVSKCIWSIRSALGEDSKSQRFIQTVPKRGYRFVADVAIVKSTNGHKAAESIAHLAKGEQSEHIPGSNVIPMRGRSNFGGASVAQDMFERPDPAVPFPFPESRETSHKDTHHKPVKRPIGYFAASILVLLLVMVAGTYYFFRSPSASAVTTGSRLAVLPLKPVTAEIRDPIIEFAIAESLILKISTAPNLTVRPLGAVRKYVELDRDPIDAGKELNADYVLSSNYQLVDGRIRVTSQLFNIQTGKAEATFKAESDTQERFAMQDALANEIGNALFGRFGQPGTTYAVLRGTNNEEAYRVYLQGHYLVEKKILSDAARAIELFDTAIKLDPNYAQAWAGKANAHCTLAHLGGIEPGIAFESARPALKKAFELDPNLSETAAVTGLITFDYDWDLEKGLQYFRKAVELNPKNEMAGRSYATRLARIGRYDEALQQIKASIDIFPNSIFHQADYALILYSARRYDEAIAQIHRVLEMDPNMTWVRRMIWLSYHLNGEHDRAYEWFMKIQDLNNVDPAIIQGYRHTFASAGWEGVLKRYAEVVRSRSNLDGYDPNAGNVVFASSLIGDKDTAFKYLETSLQQRDLWIPYLLRDPAYDSLREDPRDTKLLRNTGLPVEN